MSERQYGKHRGLVTANNDPLNQGRIQAKVPEVLPGVDTGWALPATAYAGPGEGTFMVPPVGAGVWIEFEAGDVSRPIWTGCWWAQDDRPANHDGAKATPPLKIVRSEQGLLLSFDDDGETIALSDSSGDNIVTIEVKQGQVTVKAATKVVVDAPKIELVADSTHPLVFGDELLTYLNQVVSTYAAHLHPAQLCLGVLPVTPAPPVPPFPPATPSLISTRVTTG